MNRYKIEGLILSAWISIGLLLSSCVSAYDNNYWAGVATGLQQVENSLRNNARVVIW